MIHYHGTPMGGDHANRATLQGRHACVSYVRPDDLELAAEVCQSFILDNGAYTIWRQGGDLVPQLDDIAEWITKWARHPGYDWHLMPDDITGGTEENELMRARWFARVDKEVWRRGVPVWHPHETLDLLQEMLVWNHPAIAIGGSHEYPEVGAPSWWSRIAEAMEILCDSDGYPIRPIHGLRLLDPTVFSHLPLASADSTNVARNSGTDSRWQAAYAPRSRPLRSLILMDRIESHAAAARWSAESAGIQRNFELFG